MTSNHRQKRGSSGIQSIYKLAVAQHACPNKVIERKPISDQVESRQKWSKRGMIEYSAHKSRIDAIKFKHNGRPEKQLTRSLIAASLSHPIWTRLPRQAVAKWVNARRIHNYSKRGVVSSRVGALQWANACARSFGSHSWIKQTKDGKQTPPIPKKVEASTLIRTSQRCTGENARITNRYDAK